MSDAATHVPFSEHFGSPHQRGGVFNVCGKAENESAREWGIPSGRHHACCLHLPCIDGAALAFGRSTHNLRSPQEAREGGLHLREPDHRHDSSSREDEQGTMQSRSGISTELAQEATEAAGTHGRVAANPFQGTRPLLGRRYVVLHRGGVEGACKGPCCERNARRRPDIP